MKAIKLLIKMITISFAGSCAREVTTSTSAIKEIANTSPGVQYTMMKDFSVVMEATHGFADIGKATPVDSGTLFNGNSVTKTLTAVAVLNLVDEGKMRLTERVSTYLDSIPFKWDITIQQLLSHSSGLKNPIPLRWIHLQTEHQEFNKLKFFNAVMAGNTRQSNKPGSKFQYSNLNYLILGYIIEKVSGVGYEEYVKSTIIDPLGAQIFFKIDSSQRYAYGYQKRYTLMSAAMGFFLDEDKFIESREQDWLKFKPFYNNGAAYGGSIGNAKAFNLYLQELMRGDSKIISASSKNSMLTATEESKGLMALSWFTGVLDGHRYFCHAGGGGGHYCEIRFYPDLNVSSVIMLNRSGMKDERLLDKTDRSLLRQLAR